MPARDGVSRLVHGVMTLWISRRHRSPLVDEPVATPRSAVFARNARQGLGHIFGGIIVPKSVSAATPSFVFRIVVLAAILCLVACCNSRFSGPWLAVKQHVFDRVGCDPPFEVIDDELGKSRPMLALQRSLVHEPSQDIKSWQFCHRAETSYSKRPEPPAQ